MLVHDDGERHAIQPRNDAPVIFRRAPVNGDGVALGRVTDALDVLVQQVFQHHAAVIRRAPDQEVARAFAPRAGQPVDIRLKAAGGRDDRLGRDPRHLLALLHIREQHTVALELHMGHLRLVGDLDAQILGGVIVGVHQRFAPAKEERVGAGQGQGARQAGLKAHAMGVHPWIAVFRFPDRHAGQRLIRLARSDLHQVIKILVLAVSVRQHPHRPAMHAAEVSRVARIAAAIGHRCGLHHQHLRAALRRADRRAQRRVPAADHQNVGCG